MVKIEKDSSVTTEKNSEDREEEGCIGGIRNDPRGVIKQGG